MAQISRDQRAFQLRRLYFIIVTIQRVIYRLVPLVLVPRRHRGILWSTVAVIHIVSATTFRPAMIKQPVPFSWHLSTTQATSHPPTIQHHPASTCQCSPKRAHSPNQACPYQPIPSPPHHPSLSHRHPHPTHHWPTMPKRRSSQQPMPAFSQ